MTPRELTRDQTHFVGKPFTEQELVLHGGPNWTACLFFALIASLHLYIAIHLFGAERKLGTDWEGLVSSLLGACFVIVAVMCALIRSEISICPKQQTINLRSGFGRFSTDRSLPFEAVRAVRVTMWHSKRGPHSRVEILCDGEEIPCPHTDIPRQQALYLALVMNVRLIKISDDRAGNSLRYVHSESTRL